jgi:leucyl-tRNA synthetase
MHEAISAVTLMLAPFTPHLSHVLWNQLDNQGDVVDAKWPEADPNALVEESKLIIVQVNGKLRARITVAADAEQATVQAIALADENVTKFTQDATIRKVIYVPGKLLNIVAN